MTLDRFDPYPEHDQPSPVVPGYPGTARRTPSMPPLDRPPTRTTMTGPTDLAQRLAGASVDLAEPAQGKPALGQRIHVGGRVLDEDGRPVAGGVVELWQANAAGRYDHPADSARAPLDPNFLGHARTATDAEGRWHFLTVRPGAYPVPDSGRWWRPAHLHFSVLGPAAASRLMTQMYFPGDPMLEWDRIWNSVPDAAARARLVARPLPPAEAREHPDGERLAFVHDLVLQGRRATPAWP